MMEKFYGALAVALRADTGAGSLVTLTGYNASTNLSIARGFPHAGANYPSLWFIDDDNEPAIANAATNQKITTVDLVAADRNATKSALTCIQIADRLDFLMGRHTSSISYYSITNSDVSNCMTDWISRDPPIYDEDLDAFMITTRVKFRWNLK